MNEPIIRAAKIEDAEAIHDAHMRSIREVCVVEHGAEEIKGWGFRPYDANHRHEVIARDPVWVVEADAKIEGYAHLRLTENNKSKEAYLWALYLTPKVIGKGFGLKLANLMFDAARSFGAEKVTLQSSLTARAFYKKFGFAETAPMQRSEINGHLVSNYPMEMKL